MDNAHAETNEGRLVACEWEPKPGVAKYVVRFDRLNSDIVNAEAHHTDGTVETVSFLNEQADSNFEVPDDVGCIEFKAQTPVVAAGKVMQAMEDCLYVDGVRFDVGQEIELGGRIAKVAILDA